MDAVTSDVGLWIERGAHVWGSAHITSLTHKTAPGVCCAWP